MKSWYLLAVFVLIITLPILFLTGCGSTPTPTTVPTDTPEPPRPTPTAAPTNTPEPESKPEPATGQGVGTFEPLASADCETLASDMGKALGVKLATSNAAFTDYIGGQNGTGCQATATGTGADFGELPAVASKLQKMLEDQGWIYDMQYQADGPAGTGMGFHKESSLCLLTVNWEPSEDADCPDDQPLAACKLKPEQKLFTIVLNCAQTSAQ